MAVSESGEETARPSAVMITSPAVIPAASAAVPHSTPSTSAPESTGATEAGTPAPASVGRQPIWDAEPTGSVPRLRSWAACARGLAVVVDGTITPRNPPTPITMPGEERPETIRRSALIAVLIGIA